MTTDFSEEDFDFMDMSTPHTPLTLSLPSHTSQSRPLQKEKEREKDKERVPVCVRLSDLAQYGITVNEIQDSGMIFDPNHQKWVKAEGIHDEEVDLTGFEEEEEEGIGGDVLTIKQPQMQCPSESGSDWDQEEDLPDDKAKTKQSVDMKREPLKTLNVNLIEDLDNFEMERGNEAPIDLSGFDTDGDENVSTSPKIKLKSTRNQSTENYDSDFDDNTSNELSHLTVPKNKKEELNENDLKVSDFLKQLRLTNSSQSNQSNGPRLIRPEDVTSLLNPPKKIEGNHLNSGVINRNFDHPTQTNITVSTLSDTLDDFDDLLLDDPSSSSILPNFSSSSSLPQKPMILTSKRPSSRGTISFGGSTHEDTLSDKDTTGQADDEMENWDEGFDTPSSLVLSIHPLLQSPSLVAKSQPIVSTPPVVIVSTAEKSKSGKKNLQHKMKLFTPADFENNNKQPIKKGKGHEIQVIPVDSTPLPQLLMKFDPVQQKWVNNDAVADVPPLEEINWDDDLLVSDKSSMSLKLPGKTDLSRYMDSASLDELDEDWKVDAKVGHHPTTGNRSINPSPIPTNQTKDRERISSMSDFQIDIDVARNCQREHDTLMLQFLSEEEYSKLTHSNHKVSGKSSSSKPVRTITQRKDETEKKFHQRKNSRGEPLGPEILTRATSESAEEKETAPPSRGIQRRKTPPRIRVPSSKPNPLGATTTIPAPISRPSQEDSKDSHLKSSPHHPPLSGIGPRKRKVFQDVWKLYDGHLPS